MHQAFSQEITSTTLRRIWSAEVKPSPEEERRAVGTRGPRSAALWNIVIEGKSADFSADATTVVLGVDVEVRWTIGDAQQTRLYTVGGSSRRWRGMATAVEVWAKLTTLSGNLIVTGTAAWDAIHSQGAGASPVMGTHLVAGQALSFTQATTDGAIAGIATLGTAQEEARRFSLTSGPLITGSAMVPVTVTLYGRRFINSIWIPLDSMVVTSGFGGGNMIVVDVVPGQFNALGYNVTGFPAANGGSASIHAWEELDSEGC